LGEEVAEKSQPWTIKNIAYGHKYFKRFFHKEINMKFTVTTTDYIYNIDEAEKLMGLGFEFEGSSNASRLRITTKDPEIEINTIDELMEFVKKFGDIVVSEPLFPEKDANPKIEIYDGYRE
jgi:hypothetical protein